MKLVRRTLNSLCYPTASIPFRILMAILTLVIVGGAIVGILRTKEESFQVHHRKAVEISEYGLMLALQRLHEDPSWRNGFARTEYNDGWYKVDLVESSRDKKQVLTVVSRGGSGSIKQEKKIVLQQQVQNLDTSWIPLTY